jgi:uncharacterized protein YneF (UPF0154 family)
MNIPIGIFLSVCFLKAVVEGYFIAIKKLERDAKNGKCDLHNF